MTNTYLINETLLFEPEMRRLGPLKGYPERSIALHGPVSECLLQLLENNDRILSQRFLFAAIWEKHGTVVTTNALYQTIASVRKALKTAGLAEDVIKTFPKEGFKSTAVLRVGKRDDFITSDNSPSAIENTGISAKTVVSHSIKHKTTLAYWLAGGMFILSCSIFWYEFNHRVPVFDHYQKVGKIGGCEVFSSWHNIDKSRSTFETLTSRYPVQCSAGMFAYLSLNIAQHGMSVIVCDRNPKASAANCRSIFYRQHYNE